MKTPGSKLYGLLRHRDAKVLREYYSGVPLSDIRRRYGITESRLKGLSSSYMNGEIDIFDARDKIAIEMARKDDKEKIRQLEDKIRRLEESVKLSRIKIEGYEYMLALLKEEEGIDLLKKAGAGQSGHSGGDTEK